jgi:biotin synthase-like enzyme
VTPHAVTQQLLDGIEQRERELPEQIVERAARLREAQAERETLATTSRTVLALDLPETPEHVEGTRANLKHLVSPGFLDETEPGLFQQPGLQAPPIPADQRS